MKKILYSIAKDSENKICLADKSSKSKKYFCIECESEMILRKSESRKRRPHFAHKNLSEDCTPESALHKYFKEKLYNIIKSKLDNKSPLDFSWTCVKCSETHNGNLLKKVDDVKLESNVDIYRPDIILYDKESKPFAAIEVVVTHFPELEVQQYYKENGIILIIFEAESFDDAQKLEEKIYADFVDLCINPICKKHKKRMNSRILKIVETYCWRCGHLMDAAFIDFEEGDGPECFTNRELKLARKNNVLIKKQFSQTMLEEYLANTCRHCNAFIGINFITELKQIDGKKVKTGYLCKDCNYEKYSDDY